MILKQDGSVWSCGLNSNGQLGMVSKKYTINSFERAIPRGATALAAGTSHSMVLKQDGTVWITGSQLTFAKRREYIFGQEYSDGEAIAAGSRHSMVLTSRGSVWAMGWNKFGQLGDMTSADKATFVPVMHGGVKAVTAGHIHSIVLKLNGTVWATGDNKNGQLGDGTAISRKYFVQVMSGAKAVAAGGYHSMVLKQDDTVWATGWNVYGQLGDTTMTDRNIYCIVSRKAKAIAAGTRHSIVLKQDGSVWTTGYNRYGQLGDMIFREIQRTNFVQVISGGVKAVAAGGFHSMVSKQDDTVWTAGSNQFGQLCDGNLRTTQNFVRVAQIYDGAIHVSTH